ncbi:DNA polymerase III subunit delta [Mergibacter septicus]|uniref:DNA polymerase III subunit delta n=1 Tax=Mergibacter septicus TaxID=221402 RepID=A0A8D4LJA4_9PAST|nr:DNA polymerase III subunit delta [Mergibacter septicus]AWX15340.1 DNA polymerase III subunit delta [Mergibacter septicus]QDJ14594.1 DNA polymerase III subunit delta [Mergibacter septicus]WMR96421.1 DNA polymerase III subunit delta [Mergibacter septicus]
MQRIYPEHLSHSLQQGLKIAYLISGQDLLLLEESKQLIYQTAIQQGFDEKKEITINNSTDWNEIYDCCQAMGLFFTRQILVLNLPENLNHSQQTKLNDLIKLLHNDILLLLTSPKFNKSSEKQPWFIAFSQLNTALISCNTPTVEQLPQWIIHRAKTMGLTIEAEAVQLLAYSYESNLLALKQTLQLLQLLYPDNKLSFNRVKSCVEQSSVFTPYQWIDALLMGKSYRALRILNQLQQEDLQPVLLLRLLQRELQILLELINECSTQTKHEINFEQLRIAFDRLKIWKNRRPLYTNMLKRLNKEKLYKLFQQLADIERILKRDFSNNIWQQIENISLTCCQ